VREEKGRVGTDEQGGKEARWGNKRDGERGFDRRAKGRVGE